MKLPTRKAESHALSRMLFFFTFFFLSLSFLLSLPSSLPELLSVTLSTSGMGENKDNVTSRSRPEQLHLPYFPSLVIMFISTLTLTIPRLDSSSVYSLG